MARQISRGFTLIEVLIALAITALVATLSFSSLSAVLSSVESLRSPGERISGLNRAWTIMARDLRQFAGRPMRNEFGLNEVADMGRGGGGQRPGVHPPGLAQPQPAVAEFPATGQLPAGGRCAVARELHGAGQA